MTSPLIALAREAMTAGDIARAAELAARAGDLQTAEDRLAMLRVRAQLALVGAGEGMAAYPVFVDDAERLAPADPPLAALVLLDVAALALYMGDMSPALAAIDRAHHLAGADPAVLRQWSLVRAVAASFEGDLERSSPLLTEAIEPFRDPASLADSVQALQSIVVGCAAAERYDIATELSQRALVAARRLGAIGVLPLLLGLFSNSAYFIGDYDAVLLAAGEAEEMARRMGQPAIVVIAGACSALAHAVRGSADQVHRLVAASEALMQAGGMDAFWATYTIAKGLLALGTEDVDTAADTYAGLADGLRSSGQLTTGVTQWRADHIEALHRAGRLDAARSALDDYEAAMGDRPMPWSRVVTARCRGIVTDVGWRAHLQAAIDRYPPASMSPVELGRTHLVWAERAATEGCSDESVVHAEEALRLFRRVGAAPWAAQAEKYVSPRVALTAQPPPATTVVRALGPLTVVREGVEAMVPVDSAGLLLRFLVVRGGRATAEEAADVLWPDASPAVAAARLRNLLSRIRRRWGGLVERQGAILLWAPGVTTDVDLFEQEAVAATHDSDVAAGRRAVARYRGEFLEATRYLDWTALRREQLKGTYCRLLRFLAIQSERAGAVDEAVIHLEQAIQAEPHDEGHYILAAELLLTAGRPGAARRFLARAEEVAHDLGVPASEPLRQLQDRLRQTG